MWEPPRITLWATKTSYRDSFTLPFLGYLKIVSQLEAVILCSLEWDEKVVINSEWAAVRKESVMS
jgi:hypothetical protein